MMNCKPNRLPRLRALAIACSACVVISLHGDTQTERSVLSQISQEIEHLSVLIQRAESLAEPNQRLQFQYGWLRRDLDSVRDGIDAYIERYNLEPRSFERLQADYTR